MPVPPSWVSGLVQASRPVGRAPEGCWFSLRSSNSEPQPDAWVLARRWSSSCPFLLECGLWVPRDAEAQVACKTLKCERGSTVGGWSPRQPREMGSSPVVSCRSSKVHLLPHCTHLLGEGVEWMPEGLTLGCRAAACSLYRFLSISLSLSLLALLPTSLPHFLSTRTPKPQSEQTRRTLALFTITFSEEKSSKPKGNPISVPFCLFLKITP